MSSFISSRLPERKTFGSWLIVFIIANAIAATGISLSLSNGDASWLSQVYLVVAMFIHFLFAGLILAVPVYLFGFITKSVPLRIGLSITLFSLALLIIITNVKVYSLYHFHLNGMVLNLVFGGALLENLSFSWIMWRNIALLILATVASEIALTLAIQKFFVQRIGRPRKYVVGIFCSLVIMQLVNGFADALSWHQITTQNRYIPWMQATTMRSSLAKLGFDVTKKSDAKLTIPNSGLQYPLQPLKCEPKAPPNIIILVVDSLRFDLLTPEVMPNTYRFMEQSLSFNNHYSTGNATRFGLFGLIYGLPSTYWKPMLVEERGSVLFDVTIENDYQHFIYGSSKLTSPEFDRTAFSRLRDQLAKGAYRSPARNDLDITERFLRDIDNADPQRPIFGFLFFDAAHGFSLPDEFSSPFSPMLEQVDYMALNNDYDPTSFFNLYKATNFYIDSLIQQILEHLEAKQLLENSIVIITSDHGQEFNETKKNYWGHNSNFSRWQTKVPLVIHWPGRAPEATEALSSHEDFLPTLLQEGLGCSSPTADYSTGRNLFYELDNDRSLLLESWTDRAIQYQHKLYLINTVGNINVVDEDYSDLQDQSLPPMVLQKNLEKMSRFMRR